MSFPFVNLRPLNSGGNGDLFIAQRKGTGEPVVIKFLREWQSADARRAFAREVGVLRRKLHGLVPILFADLNAKRPYYAMPYLSRGPLTRYPGRLADGELHAVAVAIANTLANLHSAFEAHGDIKPDNILVTQFLRLCFHKTAVEHPGIGRQKYASEGRFRDLEICTRTALPCITS